MWDNQWSICYIDIVTFFWSLSSARNWYLNMGLWSLPTRRKFWNKQIFAKQYTLVQPNLLVTTLYHLLELCLRLPTPELAHQTWWRDLHMVYERKWVRKWHFVCVSLSVYESDMIQSLSMDGLCKHVHWYVGIYDWLLHCRVND